MTGRFKLGFTTTQAPMPAYTETSPHGHKMGCAWLRPTGKHPPRQAHSPSRAQARIYLQTSRILTYQQPPTHPSGTRRPLLCHRGSRDTTQGHLNPSAARTRDTHQCPPLPASPSGGGARWGRVLRHRPGSCAKLRAAATSSGGLGPGESSWARTKWSAPTALAS